MVYDNEAVDPAYTEARDRATWDHGLAAVPRITALLIANGHSPDEAAKIVLFAQRSWSNPT
jgi:hypothetical protein